MIYRQGDILVIATHFIPAVATPVERDNGRIVLAYGEVTGHAHAIADRGAELLSAPDSEDRFLRIMATSGVELRHDEHDTIVLPAGDYVVRRQREYASVRRDDHKCVKCGWSPPGGKRIRVGLEVNHIHPLAAVGVKHAETGCHHHLDNLETLCHECHAKVTTAQARSRADRRRARVPLQFASD